MTAEIIHPRRKVNLATGGPSEVREFIGRVVDLAMADWAAKGPAAENSRSGLEIVELFAHEWRRGHPRKLGTGIYNGIIWSLASAGKP